MLKYLSRGGQEITQRQWFLHSINPAYAVIRREKVGGQTIETRWLGVWMADCEPQPRPFVVTVACEDSAGKRDCLTTERYFPTEADALRHHLEVEEELTILSLAGDPPCDSPEPRRSP